MTPAFKKQLLEQVEQLDPDQQKKVLDFARSMAKAGTRGEDVLRFAGTIDAEDLEAIKQAIDDACERVNPDEW